MIVRIFRLWGDFETGVVADRPEAESGNPRDGLPRWTMRDVKPRPRSPG
jgi:hypothetical protein